MEREITNKQLFDLIVEFREDNTRRFDEHDRLFEAIGERFNGVDVRLDGIDIRLDNIDVRLDGIDVRLDGMVTKDYLDGRLASMESGTVQLVNRKFNWLFRR